MFRGNKKGKHTTIVSPPQAGHEMWLINLIKGQNLVDCILDHTEGGLIVVDWVPATKANNSTTMRDLERGILKAIEFAEGCKTHVVGLCQGGCVAALTESHYKRKIDLLTLAGSPIDTSFKSDLTKVQKIPPWVYAGIAKLHGGIIPGQILVDSWRKSDAAEHDRKEKLPENKRFYEWYNTAVSGLANPWHNWTIQHVFYDNDFRHMMSIDCDINLAAGTRDTITPAKQLFAIEPNCHAKVTKHMVNGGHVGVFIGKDAIFNVFPKILRQACLKLDA
jgi:poly(3-hydroxyalkanoate) synthetase